MCSARGAARSVAAPFPGGHGIPRCGSVAGRTRSRKPDVPPYALPPPAVTTLLEKSKGQVERQKAALAFFLRCSVPLVAPSLLPQGASVAARRSRSLRPGRFGRCGGGRGSPLVRPYGVRLLRSLRGDEGRHSRPLEDARRPPEGDRGFCAAAAARLGLGCKGLVVLLPFSEAVYALQPQGLQRVRTAHIVYNANTFYAPLPGISNKI